MYVRNDMTVDYRLFLIIIYFLISCIFFLNYFLLLFYVILLYNRNPKTTVVETARIANKKYINIMKLKSSIIINLPKK